MNWIKLLTNNLIQYLSPGPNYVYIDINTRVLIINIYNIIKDSYAYDNMQFLELTDLLISFGLL
jgi:hypothetical protein